MVFFCSNIDTKDSQSGPGKSSLAGQCLYEEVLCCNRQSHKRKSCGFSSPSSHQTPCGEGTVKKLRLDDTLTTPNLNDVRGGTDRDAMVTSGGRLRCEPVGGVAGITHPVLGKSVEQNRKEPVAFSPLSNEGNSKQAKRRRHRTYSIPSKEEEEEEEGKAVPPVQQESCVLYGVGGRTNAESAESESSTKLKDVGTELGDSGMSSISTAAAIPPVASGNVARELVKEVGVVDPSGQRLKHGSMIGHI